MEEVRENFPELFSLTNIETDQLISSLNNNISYDLRLGQSYSYVLDNENHYIEHVKPNILLVHPINRIPSTYETITDLYHEDDIEFIKFSETKGLEFLKDADPEDEYVIEYACRMKNKLNQYVYFIHQSIHYKTDKDNHIRYTYHRNIYLDVLTSQDKYYVTIRSLKKDTIIFSFYYDALVNEFPSLSKREKEIFNLIIEGFPDKIIAEKLFISYNTVRTHRRNILRKTESKSGLELLNKYKSNRNI